MMCCSGPPFCSISNLNTPSTLVSEVIASHWPSSYAGTRVSKPSNVTGLNGIPRAANTAVRFSSVVVPVLTQMLASARSSSVVKLVEAGTMRPWPS